MATVPKKQAPFDIRLVYLTSGVYWGALALTVIAGPNLSIFLILGLSVCVVLPVMAWAGLWVVSHLVAGEALRPRIPPMLIVVLSISTIFLNPMETCVDLHVMTRIYRAGGPKHLNEWAQKLIQDYPGHGKIVNHEDIPLEFSQYLQGYISVYGRPDEPPPTLRIEMGGGFYHFGILIVSKPKASEANWWQRRLNWPPEVFVYHDES